jgi:hypothetical protein
MNPDDHEEQEIRAALRSAFPASETELRCDLWPVLLQRLDAQPVKVPWYDWALAAAVSLSVFVFPKLVLFFAYQL